MIKRKHSNVDQSKELHEYLSIIPPNRHVIEAVNSVNISHHRDQPYFLNIPNKHDIYVNQNSPPSFEENIAPNNQKRRGITPTNSTIQPKKEIKLSNQPKKQNHPTKPSNVDQVCLVEAILNQCSPQIIGDIVQESDILQPQTVPSRNNYPLIDFSDTNNYNQQPQIYTQPTEFTNWNQLDGSPDSNNYLLSPDFILDNQNLQQQNQCDANNKNIIQNLQPYEVYQPNFTDNHQIQNQNLQIEPIYQQLSNVQFPDQQPNTIESPFYLFLPADSPEHINKFDPFAPNALDPKTNPMNQSQLLPSFQEIAHLPQQIHHGNVLPGHEDQQQRTITITGLPQLSFNSNELQIQTNLGAYNERQPPPAHQHPVSSKSIKVNDPESMENMTDSLNSLSMNESSSNTII